jgi:uncharacterized ion transporter superfamily protein YfcC
MTAVTLLALVLVVGGAVGVVRERMSAARDLGRPLRLTERRRALLSEEWGRGA